MRPESEYQAALKLIESGMNDSAIGRELGVPRGTIRDWRVGRAAGNQRITCFRCLRQPPDGPAYAYLLGAYLGDGSLAVNSSGVYRLRITCDLKYPGIIYEVSVAIQAIHVGGTIGMAERVGCVDVGSYWKHWICVFPQHGPGRKHERPISLHDWQQRSVDAYPKEFIRGLIHSDGNRHINPVTRSTKNWSKSYRYPRYMFKNASSDILGLFTDTLDVLGIHWTRPTERVISVARKDDVEHLDSFVGPKA